MAIYDLLSVVNTSEPIKHYRKGGRNNLFTLRVKKKKIEKIEEKKRILNEPRRKVV